MWGAEVCGFIPGPQRRGTGGTQALPGGRLDAEFGTDGGGYELGVVAHGWLALGFDHDSGQGFGAAVADDYATGVF